MILLYTNNKGMYEKLISYMPLLSGNNDVLRFNYFSIFKNTYFHWRSI